MTAATVTFENYADIGRYLKECRESMRVQIEHAAKDLNIRNKYIIALEAGKMNELPGGIYAKGYVQRYARYLGLDEGEILNAFDLISGKVKTDKFYSPEPTRKYNTPTPNILILSTVMIAFFYALWMYLGSGTHVANPTVEVEALPEKYARLIDPTQLPQYIAAPYWRDCFIPLVAPRAVCQDMSFVMQAPDEHITFLKRGPEFSTDLILSYEEIMK